MDVGKDDFRLGDSFDARSSATLEGSGGAFVFNGALAPAPAPAYPAKPCAAGAGGRENVTSGMAKETVGAVPACDVAELACGYA